MKCFRLWQGFLLATLASASAQVTVQVAMEQQQFLPGEAVQVAVRITNRSGQTLHLGADPDWLTFTVEGKEEPTVVAKLGDAPVAGEFELESSKVATKRVDLAPYFALGQPGRYAVVANVRIADWNRMISSPPKEFNVIQGAHLWEQTVGLPAAPGAVPEVRKYILQQANYFKGSPRLYLRVTDATGRSLKVFQIGSIVSFGQPDPQVDKTSNLHVLYQMGPGVFSYTVFNPDGDVTTRQIYDYITTRPRLRLDDQGNVAVVGGVRRVTPEDSPQVSESAPTTSGSNSPPRATQPAQTPETAKAPKP